MNELSIQTSIAPVSTMQESKTYSNARKQYLLQHSTGLSYLPVVCGGGSIGAASLPVPNQGFHLQRATPPNTTGTTAPQGPRVRVPTARTNKRSPHSHVDRPSSLLCAWLPGRGRLGWVERNGRRTIQKHRTGNGNKRVLGEAIFVAYLNRVL